MNGEEPKSTTIIAKRTYKELLGYWRWLMGVLGSEYIRSTRNGKLKLSYTITHIKLEYLNKRNWSVK